MNGEGRLRPSWARVCGVGTSGGARERGGQDSLRPPRRTVLACASLYYHPPVTLTHLFVCLSVPEVLHAHPAGLRPHQLHTTRWVSQTISSRLLNIWIMIRKSQKQQFSDHTVKTLCTSFAIAILFPKRFSISRFLTKVLNRLRTDLTLKLLLYSPEKGTRVFYRRYFESSNSNRFKSLLHLFKFLFLHEFIFNINLKTPIAVIRLIKAFSNKNYLRIGRHPLLWECKDKFNSILPSYCPTINLRFRSSTEYLMRKPIRVARIFCGLVHNAMYCS